MTIVFFGTILVFIPEVMRNDANILLILFVPGYLATRSVILLVSDRRVGEEAD